MSDELLTAETITDEQIRELQSLLRDDLARTEAFWTSHIRKEITETEWALATGEPIRRHLARQRCAEILNARKPTP
jgi:hypothetical protein